MLEADGGDIKSYLSDISSHTPLGLVHNTSSVSFNPFLSLVLNISSILRSNEQKSF